MGEATDSPTDVYLATVARMEPDIAFIDASAGWASLAISAKRAADAIERIAACVEKVIALAEADAAR